MNIFLKTNCANNKINCSQRKQWRIEDEYLWGLWNRINPWEIAVIGVLHSCVQTFPCQMQRHLPQPHFLGLNKNKWIIVTWKQVPSQIEKIWWWFELLKWDWSAFGGRQSSSSYWSSGRGKGRSKQRSLDWEGGAWKCVSFCVRVTLLAPAPERLHPAWGCRQAPELLSFLWHPDGKFLSDPPGIRHSVKGKRRNNCWKQWNGLQKSCRAYTYAHYIF